MFSFSPAIGGRGRLIVAVAVSVLIHGFLLMDWWSAAYFMPASARAGGGSSPTFRLSVLLQPGRFSGLAVDGSELSPASGGREKQGSPTSRHSDAPVGEARDEVVPEDYLSKERLSSSAEPLSDIHIPWPVGLPVMGLSRAVFTLFIDELGTVRDVVPDAHTLSPVMELVARNSFLAATFRPATLNGRAVKSMKRIEVEFEFLPTPEAQRMPEVVGSKELSQ